MTLTEVLPATAARLGVATAAGTIADDDAAPVLTIADNSAHESAGTISFPVTLDAESALQVMVNYVTESRDATAGEDYTWVADTLVFRPGERSRMISVPIRQDDLVEAEQEHFAVTLSGPVNATLGAQTATGSIIDDDTLLLSVAADSATVIEGAAATFTVEATGATSTGRVVVGYTVGGTASAGSDYTAVAAGTITFTLGGSRRQTVTVATLEGQLDEPAERFMVTLTGAQPSSAASLGTTTATATITDDDDPPPDDHGDTLASATAATPGVVISGTLQTATDVDYFRISVSASATVHVATDRGKFGDPGYQATVVRLEPRPTRRRTTTTTTRYASRAGPGRSTCASAAPPPRATILPSGCSIRVRPIPRTTSSCAISAPSRAPVRGPPSVPQPTSWNG